MSDSLEINELVAKYNTALVGYLKIHRIQPCDMDDLIQDIWMQVHAKQSQYDPNKSGIYAWILNIARYKVLDYFKEQKKRPAALTADSEFPDQSSRLEARIEHLQSQIWAYKEIFRLTFLCGGYPHEQLALGFSKILLGSSGPRGVEGKPAQAQTLYGGIPIQKLIEQFVSEFQKKTLFSADFAESAMSPVRLRSELKLSEMIRALEEHLKSIADQKVKKTTLNDYIDPATNRANHPFTDWSNRVQRNIRRVLGLEIDQQDKLNVNFFDDNSDINSQKIAPKGCNRCKLRTLPPCNSSSDKEIE